MKINNLLPLALLLFVSCSSPADPSETSGEKEPVAVQEQTASVPAADRAQEMTSSENKKENASGPSASGVRTRCFVPPVIVDEVPPVIEENPEELQTTIGSYQSWDVEPVREPEPMPMRLNEPIVYTIVDESPEFPGGMQALKKYLQDNLVYPASAKDQGIEGRCYLKFIVSDQGNISDVKTVRGVAGCPECDKEAVRIVKGMPNWSPGKISGKAVNSYFALPVSFKLPE